METDAILTKALANYPDGQITLFVVNGCGVAWWWRWSGGDILRGDGPSIGEAQDALAVAVKEAGLHIREDE